MRRFITWLYYRLVFKPTLDEKIDKDKPQLETYEIEYISHDDIRVVRAQIERKRISDGELH